MPHDYAHQLTGHTLRGGWTVVEKVAKTPGQTGGAFSVGYRVESPDGKWAFCKALDFADALASTADPARMLGELLEAYNFERDLLAKCKGQRMDRVVLIIGDGSLQLEGGNPFSVVQYLIFEMADGDVRAQARFADDLDAAWALRSLHHVATGLKQLHRAGVAHQDLKPSNVMTFEGVGAKIGDLGRATDQSHAMPHDALDFAGQWSYAPPEFIYGEVSTDWGVRRSACDLYLLGSLATFLFSGVNMTASLLQHLAPSAMPARFGGAFTGTFRDVLPHVQSAFAQATAEFDATVPEPFREEIGVIVRRLCDPDPLRRGDPSNHIGHRDRYALDQFVSRFDRLARTAEARMFHR